MFRESVVALVMTGDGVLIATVGIGHGMVDVAGAGAPLVVRPAGTTLLLAVEEGGRWGCMAGDALIEVGVVVTGLRAGETTLEAVA